MNKSTELPDGWTVQISKSLPNRVYYFNTKTNKSSWEFPTDEANNDIASKNAVKGRKRKTADPELSSRKATTPDVDEAKKVKGDERRVLKAKRSVKTTKREKPKTNTSPAESKDTPQMQLLREKMLERRSKGNAPKKSKIPTVSAEKAVDKVAEKSVVEVAKAETSTGSSDPPTEVPNVTPQMRVLLEKIKDRKSLGVSPKASSRKSSVFKPTASVTRRPRTRSAGSTETPMAMQPLSAVKRSVDTSAAAREDVDSLVNSKRPRIRRAKKNLAQERLDVLRKSLNESRDECDSDAVIVLDRLDEPDSPTSTTPPSGVYKNADARARLLRERLRDRRTVNEEKIAEQPDGSEERRVTGDFYEEMEWEPIEDEKLMQEIQVVRSHIGTIEETVDPMEVLANSLDLTDGRCEPRPALYIVVDTNVFLSNLTAVEEARDAIFRNYGRPLIVVPWTVLRELDFIKDDKSMSRPEFLRAKARQAVRFLHQHFSARHPRILGQTPADVSNNRQRFEHECPDDEILQTCLQIRSAVNNVVLLSYDKNLCNKAMIHDLVTLGRHDPLEKVDYLHASDAKNDSFLALHLRGDGPDPDVVPLYVKELRKADEFMEAAKEIVVSFMTVIVTKEMQNLYGENWEKYTFIKPPWSVHGVLRCATKHWIAAVSDSFARRADNILKELQRAINDVPDSGRKLNDVGYVLEIINDLLQSVKAGKYPNVVDLSARAITDLRTKCAETCRQFYEEKIRDNWQSEDERRKREEKEEEACAQRAFERFEEVYAFARDICGLASTAIGMACSVPFKKLNPEPSLEEIKEMQPEVAANLNRLLQILGTALEEINGLRVEHRAVEGLYQALANFLPERKGRVQCDFTPNDVYWCLRRKEKVLRLGLTQLQELSSHFCRMASFRCT